MASVAVFEAPMVIFMNDEESDHIKYEYEWGR